MLKLSLTLLFDITLQYDDVLIKVVGCIVGFFAGMCLFIAGELKAKKLTRERVLIRLLSAVGVIFFGVVAQDVFFPTWNTAIVVAACTFFSESIVAIASVGFIKYIKNISGVQDEYKDKIDG